MSKYDKMIELNRKSSNEKIEKAKQAIHEMIEEEERVTVPKLMKKTGLSRGFFYKNADVRKTIDRAMERQAGLVDTRRKIIDMAMDNRIELLEKTLAKLQRGNKEVKKQNEKLLKALDKKELTMLKNL